MPSNDDPNSGEARGMGSLSWDVDTKSYTSEKSLVNDIIKNLEESGACIVRNLIDIESINQILEDMDPFVKAPSECEFFAKEVTAVSGLVGRSETFALKVVGNTVWQKVLDHFLKHQYGPYWAGEEQYTSYCAAQLGSSAGLGLAPGAKAQMLHRDDSAHRHWSKEAEKYDVGRDLCLTSLTACTKTTRANGGTRVVPGSHLWDYSRPPPVDNDGVVDTELNPGDSLIILGSVIHGHGANTTTDENRMVLGCGACCDYLRQEENQYLSHSQDFVRRLPESIQRFIGYSTFDPAGGTAHWKDPWQVLNDKKPGVQENSIPCKA
ncbi:uncharacterized protein N7511_003906 [Penicillium nucicola]|uniref:uncharacterized protein n=1 Tax=Penicillium nucicola TaxID=1850975 RepID=UPI002544F519|nr:uncharacterized protein N7511_003906 [Penicillium nucicola]KAJ5766290.1 hypothetical protein N7511_003906 [Penicillium nucicola]